MYLTLLNNYITMKKEIAALSLISALGGCQDIKHQKSEEMVDKTRTQIAKTEINEQQKKTTDEQLGSAGNPSLALSEFYKNTENAKSYQDALKNGKSASKKVK